jgi:hypothetical protein
MARAAALSRLAELGLGLGDLRGDGLGRLARRRAGLAADQVVALDRRVPS